MNIVAENLGKRFNLNWIFRNFNFTLSAGNSYAVVGPNGSGKSTFLQVIAGNVPLSEGKLLYSDNGRSIHPDNFYEHISLASPYLELIEEFTLMEHLQFHFRFKKMKGVESATEIIDKLGLSKATHREIRFFSSGMKQRVKLALSFFSDTPVLMLDEPTANLDKAGIAWYQDEIVRHLKDRLVIICSNQEYEYVFCNELIPIGQK
jgi:ABC-2 type transport system ATP-binding protein